MKNPSPLVVLLVVLTFGCGENLQTPAPVISFNPPTGLRAVSVNQSTVRLTWSAPSGASDSTFQGYIMQIGNVRDTLPKSQLDFVADSLPQVETAFFIYSLRNDGLRSDAATIRWAPAARFDSAFTVFENNTPVSTRPEGFHVGSATTNPSTMIIDPTDPTVRQHMDFFVDGSLQRPLSLWSAHLLNVVFNQTLFSTQTDTSTNLDFPLAAFPAENTFVKDTIAVADNTIYYARVVGDQGQFNFVRIHVRIKPGLSFPDRAVEIRVSLQRVPGLLYAFDASGCTSDIFRRLPSYSFIQRNHS